MAVVAIVVADLHLPASSSLKDKRRIVRGLIDRLHQRYRVSIAEIGHLNVHQRTQLGIAVVAQTDAEVDRLVGNLRDVIEECHDAVVANWERDTIDLS
jgi:hypothetical protein